MRKTFILHVGVHKTGTTSIQSFLAANRARLRALDIDVYAGYHLADNHVELHTATMREDRQSPFKLDHGLVVDTAYRAAMAARIQEHIARSPCSRILFSAEGLSYLRHIDEIERLKDLLPPGDIRIIIYTRDRAGFLASYRREMERHQRPANIGRDSFAYVADDTWLVDFEQRIAIFATAFGRANVTVLDYDAQMREAGNVIPSFLNALGVGAAFDRSDWNDIFENRRSVAG